MSQQLSLSTSLLFPWTEKRNMYARRPTVHTSRRKLLFIVAWKVKEESKSIYNSDPTVLCHCQVLQPKIKTLFMLRYNKSNNRLFSFSLCLRWRDPWNTVRRSLHVSYFSTAIVTNNWCVSPTMFLILTVYAVPHNRNCSC